MEWKIPLFVGVVQYCPHLSMDVGFFCAFLCPKRGFAMPIRRTRPPFNQTVTVRLADDLIDKIDIFAIALNRSRTDMMRHILQHATLTGMPDVAAKVPLDPQPRAPVSGIIRERLQQEANRDLQAAGAGDGD
jgi:hypothetical protein